MDQRTPTTAPTAAADPSAAAVRPVPAFLPAGMFPVSDEEVHTSVSREGISCILESRAESAVVRFVYTPIDGTLADLELEINGADPAKISDGGGITIEMGGRSWAANDEDVERRLVSCEVVGDSVEARWSWRIGEEVADFLFRLTLAGKTLVVELSGGQGKATGVDLGQVTGCPHPRVISIPYLTLGEGGPCVLCPGVRADVFVSSLLDWTGSRASSLYAPSPSEAKQQARLNGGCTYLPRTDGKRSHLHERWLVTASRQFAEVLPAVPPSEAMPAHPLLQHSLWYNVPALSPGEESYIEVYERLRGFKQWGLDNLLVNHPADTWDDGNGSSTYTLAGAPSRGGDDALGEYLEAVGDLGYTAALAVGYHTISATHPQWTPALAALSPDGNPAVGGTGRYQVKPDQAVALAVDHVRAMHERYRTQAAYVPTHASLPPWAFNDYDAAVEGAGSFHTSYRWQRAILQSQVTASPGPVTAEGGNHWLYTGLVHGFTGRQVGDQPARRPLVVDFALRYLHLRQVIAGVGTAEEFFGEPIAVADRHSRSAYLHRYLGATLAYGHAGVLPDPAEWDLAAVIKAYYLLAPVQPLLVGVPVTAIRYHRAGTLIETDEALRSGAYESGQVQIVYDSGLHVWVNGSWTETWDITCGETPYSLPPGGFLAHGPGGVLVYSADDGEGHIDYARTATHYYADARGTRRKVGALTTDGAVIVTQQKWNIEISPIGCHGTIEVDLTRFWSDRRLPPLRLLAFRPDEDDPVPAKATTVGTTLSFTPEDDYCRYRITLPEWMVEPGR